MSDAPIPAGVIFDAVCRVFKVSSGDMLDRAHRPGDIMVARRALVFLLRKRTIMSFPEIAKSFGGGHSSWVECNTAAQRTYANGLEFRDRVDRAENMAEAML